MTKFECRKTDTAKKSDFVIIYSENRDTSFPPTRWGQRHFFLANIKLTIHFLICFNERKSIREICLLLLLPTVEAILHMLDLMWWSMVCDILTLSILISTFWVSRYPPQQHTDNTSEESMFRIKSVQSFIISLCIAFVKY